MRIVVTGAAGFIGSIFSLRAKERGHDVLALDNLSRGLNGTMHVKGLTFAQHDCQGGFAEAMPVGYAQPRAGVSQLTIDAVAHFAAGTGSLDRPIEELRALNVEMTKRVYEDAKMMQAKIFAFPTTSLALGVPDSPYVISKEEAFAWIKEQTDVPVLPLRFFNVAGSYKGFTERRRHEVHLIPRLVECYRSGAPLVINGDDYTTRDGTPSRDFVNVLDVVETILFWIEECYRIGAKPTWPTGDDGALWIGTGYATTALHAIEIFEQFFGHVEWKVGPRRVFDVGELRCPSEIVVRNERIRGRRFAPSWVSIRDEVTSLLDEGFVP